jgi:hypothetical protein
MSANFSWRAYDPRADPWARGLARGSYATESFDQHSVGWCGCCYIVAVVQAIEDRGHVTLGVRHRVDMQTVLDHFHATGDDGTWNACHGGYPAHVVECLASGACPLRSASAPWRGHPVRTSRTPLGDAPFRVVRARRVPSSAIAAEILAHGPVVLEICAQTLKSVDGAGVVADPTYCPANHAVAVVGWTTRNGVLCWIVRNSWGRNRVPAAIPDDLACVSETQNACDVAWEYWVGDPRAPGFCYLPVSHPALHLSHSPWIVPDLVPA